MLEWIEQERKDYWIQSSSVIYDYDWMWRWLAWRNYISFKWWDPCMKVWSIKEGYANLKTQLYYKLSDKINEWLMSYMDCIVIIDWVKTDMIRVWSKIVSVTSLLSSDLRAVKRAKTDAEFKKHINSKAEQKNILWRSPDLWDTAMMRMWFEYKAVMPDLSRFKNYDA